MSLPDGCILFPQLLASLSAQPLPRLRIVASYDRIGLRNADLVHIDDHGDAAVVVLLQRLTRERIAVELPRVIDAHTEPGEPILLATYAGTKRFTLGLEPLRAALEIRERVHALVLACGHASKDQQALLRTLHRGGTVSAWSMVGCGARTELMRTGRALLTAPVAVRTAAQPAPVLSAQPGLPLDA